MNERKEKIAEMVSKIKELKEIVTALRDESGVSASIMLDNDRYTRLHFICGDGFDEFRELFCPDQEVSVDYERKLYAEKNVIAEGIIALTLFCKEEENE